MNSNSTKFNFLTLIVSFFCILLSIGLSGCGGIVRQSKLTILPTREWPKDIYICEMHHNTKICLDVRSNESLQSENLAVLNKEGLLIAHPEKTWLRPLAVLVDEAFREIWFKGSGVAILTEQDPAQLKIRLLISDCYYDELKEKMIIQMRVWFEIPSGGWRETATYKEECKIEDLQKTLLQLVVRCAGYAMNNIMTDSENMDKNIKYPNRKIDEMSKEPYKI